MKNSPNFYSEFKQLAKEGSIYIVGNIIGKSIGFILLPILTRIFPPYEFGIISLMTAFQSILIILINFGLEVSLSYFFFSLPEMRKETISSIIHINVLIFLMIFVFFGTFGKDLFFPNIDQTIVYTVIITSLISTIFTTLMQIFRFTHKPIPLITINTIQSLFTSILVIIICGKFHGSLKEFFLVNLATNFIFLLLVFFMFRSYISLRVFQSSFYLRIIKFGFPTVFGGITTYLINFTDRWMIDKMLSKEQLGIYGVGLSVAGAFEILISSVMAAFLPYSLEIIKKYEENRGEIDRRLNILWRVYSGGSLLLVIFSIFFAEFFFLLVQKDYITGKYIVSFIVIKAVLFGGTYFSSLGTWKKEKTYLYSVSVFLGGVSNIVFNFLFIPIFGITGASFATAISMLIALTASFIFSQKLWKINFGFSRPILHLVISFALSFAYMKLNFSVTLMLCFLSLAIAIPTTFKRSEINFVLEQFRNRNMV